MTDQKKVGAGNKENGSSIKSGHKGQLWKVKAGKEDGILNPCIWMQSGAVRSKNCNNFYNCVSCSYDLGMRKRVESGKQISWQDSMRRRSGLERICRHSLTNRIAKRACAYDYNCSKCDFDQFFEDVWNYRTGVNSPEIRMVKGFEVPAGHYFHDGHTWARIESGGHIRIGMDDFALKLLGKADSFDLPLKGEKIYQNRAGWVIRRDGKSADVLSPVDGVIIDVNYMAHENPEFANLAPYDSGWLLIVHNDELKESFNNLMDESVSLGWIDNEIKKLEAMITEFSGPVIGKGGCFGPDIYGSMPELGWNNLVKNFLRGR